MVYNTMHTIHVIIEFKQTEPKRSQTKKDRNKKNVNKNRTKQNHSIYITLKTTSDKSKCTQPLKHKRQIKMYTAIKTQATNQNVHSHSI